MRLFTRRRLGDAAVAPEARSAVEIALWDLAGQEAGRSVSSLLGRARDRVPVYASSVFLEEGAGGLAPRAAARRCSTAACTMVKVRVGPGVARPTSPRSPTLRAPARPTTSS